MNKYSKRALKTTATVGMSLAMVLSAAAPVSAAAIAATCASTNTEAKCKTLFYDLTKAIENVTLDELTVNSEATIDGVDDTGIIASIIINKDGLIANTSGSDYTNLRKWLDVANVIANDTATDDTAKGMFSTAYFTDDTHDAETGGLVNYYNTQLAGDWAANTIINDSVKAGAAVKAFEKMTKWIEDGFYDRLDEKLADRFDLVYNELSDRTADYVVADSDITRVFVAAWTTVLEQDLSGAELIKFPAKDKVTFEKETGLTSGTTTGLDVSKKSEINARIKAIKDSPNYYRVKNDSAVLDIIEQYEDLLGTITDLKDLLKDDSYKAFTSTKTDDEDATVKAFLGKVTYTADATTDLKKAKELAKKLDVEQYEILKALKEDVLDYAYNFETKKVGNYYVDKSGTTAGFTGDSTVKRDLGTANAYLLTLVDNKEGLFGIDVVLNYMEEFAKADKAVTTDIEKLTPTNIKAADKAKLEAAEDAYYEMKEGKYTGNLTDAQSKALRRVSSKIENLREAFDNLGTTTATGWYDKGNGNWGYNNEDGTAATKWVAAGSDWYYVKGGNMLRNAWVAQDATGAKWYYVDNAGKMVSNTTIDGFVIDANGVWTK